MDIIEATKFLGLPAQSQTFDQFLTAHGIAQRPVFKETPVELINLKQQGISLVFDSKSVYQNSYGQPREDGGMIFSSLQAYGAVNDSGFTQYAGLLPFNLSFATTLSDAIKIFGEPTVDHPSGPNRVYVWYGYHGTTISLCFLPDNQGVSFLSLENDANEPPVPFDW